MTDPVSLGLTVIAGGVALTAGWLSLPRPPALNAERWFKTLLATILRGQTEADGGDVDAWEARAMSGIPFHPAVVRVEEWLTRPTSALDANAGGHADLFSDLNACTTVAERHTRLFLQDTDARQALLSDPSELGSAYDPVRLLGAQNTWDRMVDWGAGDETVLAVLDRAVPAAWVLVGDDASSVFDALVQLGASRIFSDDLVRELTERAPRVEDRLVVVASGDAVPRVLSALADDAGLRDRVLAVVSVGGACAGTSERDDWMGAHFTHEAMNLESHRPLFFLAMQWMDLEHPETLAQQRFPNPGGSTVQDRVVRAIDLGAVSRVGVPAGVLAKALRAAVTLILLTG